jgi:catechol 2,3-dioxygenase-like lactoylglutathione lyase family enzyme
MINHISVGVADVARSARFYDSALAPLGYTRLSDSPDAIGYGSDGSAAFWVLAARKPVPPDSESGLHICLDAPTRASVDAFHQAAVSTGGHDNGAPGVRSEYGPRYSAAFVIDPDGYRVEAYCSGT